MRRGNLRTHGNQFFTSPIVYIVVFLLAALLLWNYSPPSNITIALDTKIEDAVKTFQWKDIKGILVNKHESMQF